MVFGRDDLPSGLTGLQSFSRRRTIRASSQTPTQAKVLVERPLTGTGYGYGPDGIETRGSSGARRRHGRGRERIA